MTAPITRVPVPTPASAAAPEPTHGCVRCGAPIPVSESMCERCNPLGLKAPAASQAHGTVFLAIGAAVVIMAVVGRLWLAGVGPFRATVTSVANDPAGLRVTISITNDGAAAGRITCRVDDPTLTGIGPESAFVQSPVVQGRATTSFDTVVSSFGRSPKPLAVACGS